MVSAWLAIPVVATLTVGATPSRGPASIGQGPAFVVILGWSEATGISSAGVG